jgi:hypothetical protein
MSMADLLAKLSTNQPEVPSGDRSRKSLSPAIAAIHGSAPAKVCLARIDLKSAGVAIEEKTGTVSETWTLSVAIKALTRSLSDSNVTGAEIKLIKVGSVCFQQVDALVRSQPICVHTDEPPRSISIRKQVDILISSPSMIYGACTKAIYAELPASKGRKACPGSEKVTAVAAIEIQPF